MKITHLIDLAPGENNPRNSEGSFLKLRDGRIAYCYSRYQGASSDDHAYSEIAVIFYDGNSWTEPRILVTPEPGTDEINCMSVSTARLDNGDAGLFYIVKHKGLYTEGILRRSTDEFETFDEGVRCVAPLYRNYYVVNNDRLVHLGKDRWMIPAAACLSTMGYHDQPDNLNTIGRAVFFESRDDGRTWQQVSLDSVGLPGCAWSITGLQEPGVIDLPGGTLYAYFRTDLGRQYESVSIDGGKSWFEPRPSQFTSPPSPMLIKRNDFTGKYYAVFNPTPWYPGRYRYEPKPDGRWTGGRTSLVISESEDGVHFGGTQGIEDDPMAGFCYPAMLFTGERELLLSYCAGGVAETDEHCLVRTRIVKIEL